MEEEKVSKIKKEQRTKKRAYISDVDHEKKVAKIHIRLDEEDSRVALEKKC
jgi:hypothetical protein